MVPTIQLRPVTLLGSRQNYRPMPFRPAPMPEKAMGQAGAVAALGIVPMLAIAGVSGLISWAAFSWAAKSKDTAPKILGYTLGALGALSALGSTLGAILWGTGVYAVKAAADAHAQRSATQMQQFQQSVQESQQFMNQQPSITEPFPPSMTSPTTPMSMPFPM